MNSIRASSLVLTLRQAAVCAIVLGAMLSVAAADYHDAVATANRQFADGNFEEALKGYEEALKSAPDADRPEILHNAAAAHFKLGRLQEAREAWTSVASLRDARFEAAARYNIGNCDYAEALRAASDQNGQHDASKLIELLERAKRHYIDAVALDPKLQNARANLELAEQLIRQIKDQSTTQPSSQQSPSSQQQNSSQPSSQPQQDQQQSQDQSDSTSQPTSQSDQRQQPSSQPQDDQAQNQQDQSEPQPQTQPSSQPQDQQQPQPESQPSEEPTSQPAESQPAQQPDTQPAQQPQSQPSADDQGQPQQRSDLTMTPAEAERLLQKVRDAERQRRLRLLQREKAKQRPVDKDW